MANLPTFLIIGAPKAGTTALHAALSQHPEVFMSQPKEPKYWLCDDAPPPAWRGPGDAHSQQEWVWRREDYEDLFDDPERRPVRGESTPFYLWSRGAHRRIAEGLPDVRLIAVVRDPIDRAYSNWMHLWSDGLEPEPDFEAAYHRQDERIRSGWAPFWRYRDLGRYGDQLAHLFRYVDPSRVLVLRYRTLVDEPGAAVDRACRFLGISEGLVSSIPQDNSRSYVQPGWRPRVFGPAIRAGARAGTVRLPGGLALGERATHHSAVGARRDAPAPARPGGPPTAGRGLQRGRGAPDRAHRRGLQRLAVAGGPRILCSAQAGHEVVSPVGTRRLQVEAGPPVRQRNRTAVAERPVRVG